MSDSDAIVPQAWTPDGAFGRGAADAGQRRRRAAALLATVAVHALILLLFLLSRAPTVVVRREERMPTTFTLTPAAPEKAVGAKARRSVSAAAASRAAAAVTPRPATPQVQPPQEKPPAAPPFMTLSKEDFARSDIGGLPARGVSGGGAAGAGAGAGTGGAQVAGSGAGPGGAQLYEAEWYRRPTDAELRGYLPADAPRSGWGLVACRTIEDRHVDDCQTLGESPLGSGLARAVRLAAWQFLVVPPRVDGRPLVGAWVRIRIDYARRTAGDEGGDTP